MKVQCEKCIHKDVCRYESDYKATIREYGDLEKQIPSNFILEIECKDYRNEFSL